MKNVAIYPDDRLSGPPPLRQAQLVMLRILGEIHDICQRYDIPYWLDGGSALGAVRHGGFIPWDDDMDICMLRKDYDAFLAAAERELPGDLFLQVFGKDQDYYLHWAKIRDNHSTMVEDAYADARFHKGICVDVFPCDFIPESSLLSRLEKFLAKALRYRSKNMHRGMGGVEKVNFIASKMLCAVVPVAVEKRMFTMFSRGFREKHHAIGYGLGTPFDGRYPYDMVFPLKSVKFEGLSTFLPRDVEGYLERLYGDFRKLPAMEDRKPHCSLILPTVPCRHPGNRM